MRDPQKIEFSGRLRRIEKIHRKGGGFEAAGTLGQSYYTKSQRRGHVRPLMRSVVIVLSMIVLLKGALLAVLGSEAYAAKVVALKGGGLVEQIGGFVMGVDPVSVGIAQILAPIIG